MAKPRIFISSTYYDLKHIRADLERFVLDQGYEPILNEKGNIPYGSDKRLEEYCYKEIDLCDVLVSIIGGRFGSESRDQNYSISNLELKTAIEKGRQVYIFVEKSVLAEYRTYEINKGKTDMRYAAVDDVRVYKFLEEIFALPLNNQVKAFETVHEAVAYLREQWAGLFQRLLSESARQKEVNIIEGLNSTAKTLKQLVEYLAAEKARGNKAIEEILFSNHPAFEDIQRKANIKHRVIFQNVAELNELLQAHKFSEGVELVDDWAREGFFNWQQQPFGDTIRVSCEVFDKDGRLKPFTASQWKSEWIEYEEDDIPF
jgi:hypothetical protein